MAKSKLALYQQKRDFTKTKEPSGKAKIAAAEYPRFVIQKHAATRLHYDLRLEVDGVFKSWAVTKGPSLDPKDKRLAVETEDHPLDYGDFEGTIPKGEYGGGTVMLWDRGFWTTDDDPEEAIRKGELRFTLAGEKLKGSFVLVRIRNDRERGKRQNWLLIKRHDGYEREGEGDAALDEDRSVASGRTMEAIAAGKGRSPKPFMLGPSTAFKADAVWHSNRDGTAPLPAPSIVKAKRGARKSAAAMPEFIAPQLCKSLSRPPSGLTGGLRSSSTATGCSFAWRMGRPPCGRERVSTGPRSLHELPNLERVSETAFSTARWWRWTIRGRQILLPCKRLCQKGGRETSFISYSTCCSRLVKI
jgi:bifunctional non-homologous end joining protein LigD